MSRTRAWLQSLSWPALTAATLGLMAALFAINALTWWLAHQLSWWTFALALTIGTFGWQTVKATISVVRERREKAAIRRLSARLMP